MDKKYTNIQKATSVDSIENYRRMHELAKKRMEPVGDVEDEEDDCISLVTFANPLENSWWTDMIQGMCKSKDISFSPKNMKISFTCRIKCDGKYVGKKVRIDGQSMMSLMMKCGAMTFTPDFDDADDHTWEIDVPQPITAVFEMFLESLHNYDESFYVSMQNIMSFQSGMVCGVVATNSMDYDEFVYVIQTLVTSNEEAEKTILK